MEYLLQKFHYRLKEISYQACHTEWEQHVAQTVYQPYGTGKEECASKYAHHTVECIWTLRGWHGSGIAHIVMESMCGGEHEVDHVGHIERHEYGSFNA